MGFATWKRPIPPCMVLGVLLFGLSLPSCRIAHGSPSPGGSRPGIREDLFSGAKSEQELWGAFLGRLDSVQPGDDLGSLFLSVNRQGQRLHQYSNWDGWRRRRWDSVARGFEDLALREMFASHAPPPRQLMAGGKRFRLTASQMRVGDPLPFAMDQKTVLLERRRMILGDDWRLRSVNLLETLTVDHDSGGRLRSSHPFGPGIWRLTKLGGEDFLEEYLNVTQGEVVVEADPEGFLLWTPQEALVCVWKGKDSTLHRVGPDKPLRLEHGLGRSTQMPLRLAVRTDSSVHFFQMHLDPPIPGARALQAVTWTDREAYAPGQSVQVHGLLREISRSGTRSVPRPAPAVRLEFQSAGGRVLDTFDVSPDGEGHFSTDWKAPSGLPTEGVVVRPLLPDLDGLDAVESTSPVPRWRDAAPEEGRARFVVGNASASSPPSIGGGLPLVRVRFDRDEYRAGDTAWLSITAHPCHGALPMARVHWRNEARRGDTTVVLDSTNRAKYPILAGQAGAMWSTVEIGSRGAIDSARVLGPGETSRLSRPPELFVSYAQDGSDSVDLVLRSDREGASVFVLARDGFLGTHRVGRIRSGRFSAKFAPREAGLDGRFVAWVQGQGNTQRIEATLSNAAGRNWARVRTKIRRDGDEWVVSLRVSNEHGRMIPAKLTAAVVDRPLEFPAFRSMAGEGMPKVFVWNRFEPVFHLPWGVEFERWRLWLGNARFRSEEGGDANLPFPHGGPFSQQPARSKKAPRKSLPEREPTIEEIKVLQEATMPKRPPSKDPCREWAMSSPGGVHESPLPAMRTAWWNGKVKVDWFGRGELRIPAPSAGGDWYLVLFGSAGEHFLVSHRTKI